MTRKEAADCAREIGLNFTLLADAIDANTAEEDAAMRLVLDELRIAVRDFCRELVQLLGQGPKRPLRKASMLKVVK